MPQNDRVTGAARAVIRRVGVGALTLAAVAKESGLSRATVYRRFASRDQLISTLIDAELDALESVLLTRLRFADEPRETVHMLVREVLDFNATNEIVQAVLRFDGAALTPWMIRTPDHRTIVDIVTDRSLAHVEGSELARHLHPDPRTAMEFMVSVTFAELLSPGRFLTHAAIAAYVTDAVCPRPPE